MCGAILSSLHSVSQSAWAPRSSGTFLQDSLEYILVSLGRDIHVAHGPEVRYRTPSAPCVVLVHWFLTDKHGIRLEAGVGGYYRDRTRQEAESERHKDVLERVPVVTPRHSAPPVRSKSETVSATIYKPWFKRDRSGLNICFHFCYRCARTAA